MRKAWLAVSSAALCVVAFNVNAAFCREIALEPGTDLDDTFENATAGDTFVLGDGEWKDVAIHIEAAGTEEAPVVLRAQTPGKVVVTGESRLRISGSHIQVSGLLFQNCQGESEVIAFRTASNRPARDCRITNCEMRNDLPPEGQSESKWLSIYGERNRVDHCSFAGKNNRGTTFVVWPTGQPNDHRIDHNYFGPRPELGKNGGETIRVGDSEVSLTSSRTIIERNVFEECDGEAEIISNKSCDNVYRQNTFLKCAGALTLRHGNRCTVNGNVFLGHGKRGSGGVRIIGEDHRVFNNYFEGLLGDEHRATISFMNGIPNTRLNGYAQVLRATVAFNTIIDCKVPLEIGVKAGKFQSLAPDSCTIAGNVFDTGERELIRLHSEPVSWVWKDNLLQSKGDAVSKIPAGIELTTLEMVRADDGLMRPRAGSRPGSVSGRDFSFITDDLDGQPREHGRNWFAGCDEPSSSSAQGAPLKAENVGPDWK